MSLTHGLWSALLAPAFKFHALSELCDQEDAPAAERFLAKVDVGEDGCWNWTGCAQNSSAWRVWKLKINAAQDWRPRFWLQKRVMYAHRAAWLLWRGALGSADVVMHECDNSLCVNPWHLLLGTQSENMEDLWEKRREAKRAARLLQDEAA